MKPLSHLVILAVIVCLFSCRRQQHVICGSAPLQVAAVGFTGGDFSRAVAIRYTQGHAFDSVIDSIPLTFENGSADTSRIFLLDTGIIAQRRNIAGSELVNGYDYRILLNNGRAFSITGITQSGITSKDNYYTEFIVAHEPRKCYDNIISCSINDTLFSFPSDPSAPKSIVYLIK